MCPRAASRSDRYLPMSDPARSPSASHASEKERFDVLYGRLRHIHDAFLEGVFKATAAFLLVTGWVVASETAQRHLQADPLVRWLVVLALAIYAALYAGVAVRTARNSGRIAAKLADLGYMPVTHYEDVVVAARMTLAFAAANALLVTAVAVFILRMRG